MVYLFLMSIVPTVPAGWLTFADNPVYRHYDIPVRVFGLSVISDQQLAGGIMKLGGSVFLWTVITFMWCKRFEMNFEEENSYKRRARIPDAEIASRRRRRAHLRRGRRRLRAHPAGSRAAEPRASRGWQFGRGHSHLKLAAAAIGMAIAQVHSTSHDSVGQSPAPVSASRSTSASAPLGSARATARRPIGSSLNGMTIPPSSSSTR